MRIWEQWIASLIWTVAALHMLITPSPSPPSPKSSQKLTFCGRQTKARAHTWYYFAFFITIFRLPLWTPSAYIHVFSHDNNYLFIIKIALKYHSTCTCTYMQVRKIYWHACNYVDHCYGHGHFNPCGGVCKSCVSIMTYCSTYIWL